LQNVVGPGLRFESRQKLFSTRTVLSCLCRKPINHHFCNRWIHVTSICLLFSYFRYRQFTPRSVSCLHLVSSKPSRYQYMCR
jgi:hypothetical protein